MVLTPADEQRHPGAGADRWAFELASPAARLTVELLAPDEGSWHYRAVLRDGDGAGAGDAAGTVGGVVVVDDEEVPPPRGRSLELRTHGLWAEHVVEAPFDHVSVGCEAFALRLDELPEGGAPLVGEPVPFGLDLGWEADGAPAARTSGVGGPGGAGYEVAAVVYGEILVADARLVVEQARGAWRHTWGAVWAGERSLGPFLR